MYRRVLSDIYIYIEIEQRQRLKVKIFKTQLKTHRNRKPQNCFAKSSQRFINGSRSNATVELNLSLNNARLQSYQSTFMGYCCLVPITSKPKTQRTAWLAQKTSQVGELGDLKGYLLSRMRAMKYPKNHKIVLFTWPWKQSCL